MPDEPNVQCETNLQAKEIGEYEEYENSLKIFEIKPLQLKWCIEHYGIK